jgi:hypothetical protein
VLRPRRHGLDDKRKPTPVASRLATRLAAARAALVRAEIIPTSSSVIPAIGCNRNLPVAPSIVGRSANRTPTRASTAAAIRAEIAASGYRRPRTTKPEPGHKIYPYLLRGMEIVRPNQVWAMDIT